MNSHVRTTPFLTLTVAIVAVLVTSQCTGSGSPTTPTPSSAVSGVTLSPSNTTAGSGVQGMVTLSGAAVAGGASITLSSSNTAVATVPTPVVVQAGALTAAFMVTTTTAGAATITASLNGASQSSTLTVTSSASLSSISVSSASVVGGSAAEGTVTLSADAGSGGAVVALSSADPVLVPSTVTVPGGSRSASFAIATREVGGTIAATVTGAYGGVSKSIVLTVTAVASPGVAIAAFGVTGRNVTDTCTLINNGDNLECTFNGSSSIAPGTIVAWDWSYSVATTITQTTSGPVLTLPTANCGLLPAPPLPAGTSSFPLTVRLRIRDSLGNVSQEAVDTGARVLPQGVCGF